MICWYVVSGVAGVSPAARRERMNFRRHTNFFEAFGVEVTLFRRAGCPATAGGTPATTLPNT